MLFTHSPVSSSLRALACALLCALSLLPCRQAAALETEDDAFVYGYSESGRALTCYHAGEESSENSLLLIFGVHGFEDSYDHDGEVLRLIAERILSHYREHPDALGNFCLYVVPSANPDGLLDGTTKDGFGRCNANGLDINRDFPIGWIERSSARNQTGSEPFSTAEARAIRDLVARLQPDYAIDVHGWISASYGTGRMAKAFARPFGFSVKQSRSGGMLSTWLSTVTQEAIMLELPRNPDEDAYVEENSAKLIEGIDSWIAFCTE